MSTLVIRLLGRPEIERDGVVAAAPRGHKAWAVLAYVVLAERRVGRARLAELILAVPTTPWGRCAGRWRSCAVHSALPTRYAETRWSSGCRRVPQWTCARWFPATWIPRSLAASCWKA
jgi:hypothetical protein